MSLIRSRAVLPLAALAVLASACTGTTPTAGHPAEHQAGHSGTPAAAQTSAAASAPTSTPDEPSGSPSASTTAEPAAEPCPAAALDVSLQPTGAAAGSTYQQLVFTNTGQASCTLTGFPGVSLVQQRDGAPVGAAADRTGGTRTVSLVPGGSARARLQITDAQNYPEDRCGQTPAKGLRVYPPNQTQSVFVPDDVLACAHSSVQILYVQAVRAAS